MEEPTSITFSNAMMAQAVRVQHVEELPTALQKLGLYSGYPTLVLIGGAGKMDSEELDRLRFLFVDGVVPLRATASVVFPLVGVAAVGTVALPDEPNPPRKAALLEPHHTHFVLVPGKHWGDESPWLSHVADTLSVGARSVTLLMNGGDIAWEDVEQSVQAGRPVLVVEGSGRTADALARAFHGEAADERAKRLVASGLLRVVDVTSNAGELARLMTEILSAKA